jgi:hypothetical protein
MTFFMSHLVRKYKNQELSYKEAVLKYDLSEAEQKELIILIKSMEHYHG